MSEPLRTLGRYALKRRLAAGGMGEVYLGEVQGAANFTKQVAIKRILPHLAANEAFVAKFIDEANVTVQLHHGNIVPVLELTDEGGELFIVMEYLPGRDLKAVLHRLKAQRRTFPVDLALFVAGEICDGLDYAHRRTGSDGHPLHIVHRDVSPSNVMLGAAGEVKLVDFGIARARGSLHQSISGTLQGKFAYMSPEQAEGLHVDARSDIFSTGLVLYEMLTGSRPLEGDSETETLRRVRQARIAPPSSLRPDVPPEVDALVLKALAPAPEARHVTAAAMRREMSVVLAALHSPADASMLHRFLADVFPEGVVPQTADAGPLSMDDALKLQLGALTPSVDSMGSTRTATGPSGAVRKPATFSTDDAPSAPARSAPPPSAPALPVAEPSLSSVPPVFSPSGTQPAVLVSPVTPPARPLIGRRVLVGFVGLVLATAAAWAYLERPVPATLTVVTVPPAPAGLEVRVDGSPLQGAFVGAVGDQVEVCAEARDFERRCRGPVALRAGLNPVSIELQPRMVVFRFEAEPANTTVVVEGIKDPFPQGTSQNVVLGEAVTVVWQAPGHRTLEQKYDLFQFAERRLRARLEPDPDAVGPPPSAAASNAARTQEPPAVPSTPSRTNETAVARPRPVLLQSTPEGAEVLADGKVLGRTPLEVPAPRSAQLYRLRAPGFAEATLRLEPGVGSPPRVEMVQNAPGYLSVRVEPAAGTLLLDGRDTGKNVLRAHAIPAGAHTLQARFLDRLSPVRQIEIEPGKTLELPAYDLSPPPEDRAADGVPHP
jgi:serine/threonine protein kinase